MNISSEAGGNTERACLVRTVAVILDAAFPPLRYVKLPSASLPLSKVNVQKKVVDIVRDERRRKICLACKIFASNTQRI